jgi:hypothetical protein
MAAAMKPAPAFPFLALVLCLEACAASGPYPSLARREAERVEGTAPPATPDPDLADAPVPPALLQANIDQLVRQASDAHDEFEMQREEALLAVAAASGSEVASEDWVAGEVALASLEAARADAVTALSELDRRYATERIARPASVSPSAALLAAARERIRAWVDAENLVLADLSSLMGG